MSKDYYMILGISRGASEGEIRKAYRKMALKLHPDKNNTYGSSEKFKELVAAYNVLSNKEKRENYDRTFQKNGFQQNAPGSGGGQETNHRSAQFQADLNSTKTYNFGGGWRGKNGPSVHSFRHRSGYGSPGPNPFQSGTTTSRTTCNTGVTQELLNPTVECDLYVTIDEVMYGCTKEVWVTRTVMAADGRTPRREEKMLTVNVKPGWKAGTIVVFPREGNQLPGNVLGDVVVTVRDVPHPIFKREGKDVHYMARITHTQIFRGETITVPTLTNEKIPVQLNESMKAWPRTVQRIEGKGLPDPLDTTKRGDLLVSFMIYAPY